MLLFLAVHGETSSAHAAVVSATPVRPFSATVAICRRETGSEKTPQTLLGLSVSEQTAGAGMVASCGTTFRPEPRKQEPPASIEDDLKKENRQLLLFFGERL